MPDQMWLIRVIVEGDCFHYALKHSTKYIAISCKTKTFKLLCRWTEGDVWL